MLKLTTGEPCGKLKTPFRTKHKKTKVGSENANIGTVVDRKGRLFLSNFNMLLLFHKRCIILLKINVLFFISFYYYFVIFINMNIHLYLYIFIFIYLYIFIVIYLYIFIFLYFILYLYFIYLYLYYYIYGFFFFTILLKMKNKKRFCNGLNFII